MKEIPYRKITVIVMPTDQCNMNCVYCFNDRRPLSKDKRMSVDTLEQLFRITIPNYDEVRFVWHGGEPLLMGIDFYQKVVELENKWNVNNANIINSIQSNMSLMNDELAEFFVNHQFHVGSSFDGTQNEKTRHNTAAILKGYDTYRKYNSKLGVICVVQNKNIDHLLEDYEWFKKNNIDYTLNLYISQPPYESNDLYVPAEYFSKKICELFDTWAQDEECKINISFFHIFVDYVLFKTKEMCCYSSCLGRYIGVQYNGDIYACNRDFAEEYCFGNLYDYQNIRRYFESDGFSRMVNGAIQRRNDCRQKCDIYEFCNGGCNNVATMGGNLEKNNEYICEITRNIYHHVNERMNEFVKAYKNDDQISLNPSLSRRIHDSLTKDNASNNNNEKGD